MIVYAESSAVLAWLLGEPAAEPVRAVLKGADVLTSALTLLECRRALIQGALTGRLTDEAAARRAELLESVADRWTVAWFDPQAVARAGRRMPAEPVRTLDALHLAAAVELRLEVGDIALLSLDRRVRENAERLGFEVLPA